MKKIIICATVLLIAVSATYFITARRSMTISYQDKAFNPEIHDSSNNQTLSLENVWCGSFQLIWNELKKFYGRDIELEDGNIELLKRLNSSDFNKNDIREEDFYIKLADLSEDKDVKQEIIKEINDKFNIESSNLIDGIDTSNKNGILLYSIINKEFEYINPFDDKGTMSFIDSETNETSMVKYFGIGKESQENVYENVELLAYENAYDFVLKLNTKNGEEIYLYKNSFDDNGTLDELYSEMNKKIEEYDGSIQIKQGDIIKIPNIDINYTINYDELCGKEIVGLSGKYISNAIQTINMVLDSNGGQVKSEATVITDSMASYPIDGGGYYIFDSSFVIFIKEKSKDNPYFMAKIVNPTFLVEK